MLRAGTAAPPPMAKAEPDNRRLVVAQLSGEGGGPTIVASAEAGQPMLRVRVIDPDASGAGGSRGAPSGAVPVLWVIAGAQAPQAVGVVPTAGTADGVGQIELRAALARLIESGATLAITYEPGNAANYDAPTTPIVASGTLSPI